MKVTSIEVQARNKNRVNVHVDGRYRFSLDVFQLGLLGVKIGKEYTEEEFVGLEVESQFGKAYARALEYCLMRLHSSKEVRDYLYRKTRPKLTKTGEMRKGLGTDITKRVFDRLEEKGYIDDRAFARFWVDNRNLRLGASTRKIKSELAAKGVSRSMIEEVVEDSDRSDIDEIQKVINKKRSKYTEYTKLTAYLARQGFSYSDIKQALDDRED